MKKVIIITLSIILVMACSIPVLSQDGIYAQKVDFSIYMNHVLTAFKEPIYLINDRTYVPLRELSEKQDFEVVWDGANSSIDLVKEEQGDLYPEVGKVREQMKGVLTKLDTKSLETVQQLMKLKRGDPIEKAFEIMGGPGEKIGFGIDIRLYHLNDDLNLRIYLEPMDEGDVILAVQLVMYNDDSDFRLDIVR